MILAWASPFNYYILKVDQRGKSNNNSNKYFSKLILIFNYDNFII